MFKSSFDYKSIYQSIKYEESFLNKVRISLLKEQLFKLSLNLKKNNFKTFNEIIHTFYFNNLQVKIKNYKILFKTKSYINFKILLLLFHIFITLVIKC